MAKVAVSFPLWLKTEHLYEDCFMIETIDGVLHTIGPPIKKFSIDLTGRTFGQLTAVKQIKKHWECLCLCGNKCFVNVYHLLDGHTRSCGCLHKPLKNRGAVTRLIRGYKLSAKKRSLVWDLTFDEAESLFRGNCFYCGTTPTQGGDIGRLQDFLHNGIDRLDNNRGYVVDNVVSCCKKCNFMKSVFGVEEFLLHIKKILSHTKKRNLFLKSRYDDSKDPNPQ